MPIPHVSREAIAVVCEQARTDSKYIPAAFERMVRDNPHISGALDSVVKYILDEHGQDTASLVAHSMVIQYICIENQFEADELERTIG
jgi:hypothetical protein